jgi:cytidine deaminase
MDRRSAIAAIGVGSRLMAQELGSKTLDEKLRAMLPGMGAKARELLLHSLHEPGFDGTLSAKDAGALAQLESKTVSNLMVELLPLAASYARPSISNFHVGALVRGVSGRLYIGANFEVSGQTLGATVHAEQSASANAYMHREESLTDLAVTAAPCGLCRQFLWEICYGTGLNVLTRNHPPATLKSLLPDAFGPKDLGLQKGALPVAPSPVKLKNPAGTQVAAAALEAAQMSYAPYTNSHAGVAIRTSRGRIYRGSYIENAAYNPSLGPLQVALAALTVAGDDAAQIVEAVLVEIPEKPVSHKASAAGVLSVVAPSATLTSLAAG